MLALACPCVVRTWVSGCLISPIWFYLLQTRLRSTTAFDHRQISSVTFSLQIFGPVHTPSLSFPFTFSSTATLLSQSCPSAVIHFPPTRAPPVYQFSYLVNYPCNRPLTLITMQIGRQQSQSCPTFYPPPCCLAGVRLAPSCVLTFSYHV